jgi:hypothetical protein
MTNGLASESATIMGRISNERYLVKIDDFNFLILFCFSSAYRARDQKRRDKRRRI